VLAPLDGAGPVRPLAVEARASYSPEPSIPPTWVGPPAPSAADTAVIQRSADDVWNGNR
jgi:hypothetical protein